MKYIVINELENILLGYISINVSIINGDGFTIFESDYDTNYNDI